MTRRLVTSYLLLTLVVLLVLAVPLGLTFTRLQRTDLLGRVAVDASTLSAAVEERLEAGRADRLQQLALDYRARTGDGRLLVVDPRGRVLADSDGTTGGTINPEARPEVAAALRGEVVQGRRQSTSLGQALVYVARPVTEDEVLLGAVRVTYPSEVIDEQVRRTWWLLAGLGASVLVAVALLGRWLAGATGRPLLALRDAAERLGDGDLASRAPDAAGPPEVRDLARRFNTTADRLADLLRREREFASDASHQLRTPLSVVRMRLELLDGQVAADAQQDLEAATAEVERLSRVVDDLLALARAGGVAATTVPVDLGAVAADRLAVWQPAAQERQVRLLLQGGPLVVRAAEGSVEQVLDNLLTNAIRHSPGGGTVTVLLDGALHVRDEGPGLPQEQRDEAFRRTWRADREPGPLGGSGLGLAIVARLVAGSGGTVRLDQAPGGGLDAVVSWPPA